MVFKKVRGDKILCRDEFVFTLLKLTLNIFILGMSILKFIDQPVSTFHDQLRFVENLYVRINLDIISCLLV